MSANWARQRGHWDPPQKEQRGESEYDRAEFGGVQEVHESTFRSVFERFAVLRGVAGGGDRCPEGRAPLRRQYPGPPGYATQGEAEAGGHRRKCDQAIAATLVLPWVCYGMCGKMHAEREVGGLPSRSS